MLGVLTPPKQNSPISFCDIYFFSFTMMYCHFHKKNEQQQHLFVLFFFTPQYTYVYSMSFD